MDLDSFESTLPQRESLSPERKKVRALCPCCGGGERRRGYTLTKASSRTQSEKARKKFRECNKRETIRTNTV